MAKPNFHDRSWQDIDWEAWGSQFSIVDRASSIGELQNGITTRYMEVQDLLSQLPPHAGRAHALVTAWRQEVSGYGRTVVFSESTRILRRLDDLHGQVTAQLHAARQTAKAARRARQRAMLAGGGAAAPGRAGGHAPRGGERDDDDFEGMRHSAATARQRNDDVNPGQETAATRWAAVQAAMARECDTCRHDTGKPVTARQFKVAMDARGDELVEQFKPALDNGMVRIVQAGPTQFWTSGLPNLEQLGIARFSIYRRDAETGRFEYVAGIRRPEDSAAQREAIAHGSG
jgi:hypothetical protein